ncbi:MAG: UDP-2,3-diacylglucosamine diphosphatase LpxI [Aquisalinus sp.]|nr:UDP-2,3-diacylglucosamine diphosphatase LpxI [Aquisalinus sp.]
MQRWTRLGIIAGGGKLPIKLAQTCKAAGKPYFVIRLKSFADDVLSSFTGEECGIAELGKIIRLLKKEECDAIVMAGLVPRPNFSALKPDWRGAALLPKALSAARKGDGAILNVLVDTFEAEGFLVIGAEEVADDLLAPIGHLGKIQPTQNDFSDMQKAADVIGALGPFDIGQGAVVRNGFVLAIEAAEGTDQMLRRCADLPSDVKGIDPDAPQERRGILLKRPKPGQELRVDLPTIGVETVNRAAAAGLAGIAVEADAALIMDREALTKLADEHGLFVYGFQDSDFRN